MVPVLFVLVLPFNLGRNDVVFSLTKYGMAYAFVPGIAANIYTYYYVLEVVIIVYLLFNMYCKAESVHQKKLTKKRKKHIKKQIFTENMTPKSWLTARPRSSYHMIRHHRLLHRHLQYLRHIQNRYLRALSALRQDLYSDLWDYLHIFPLRSMLPWVSQFLRCA